jgi:hypothetical protein
MHADRSVHGAGEDAGEEREEIRFHERSLWAIGGVDFSGVRNDEKDYACVAEMSLSAPETSLSWTPERLVVRADSWVQPAADRKRNSNASSRRRTDADSIVRRDRLGALSPYHLQEIRR